MAEKQFNTFLGQVSKKTLENNKRLEEQAEKALKFHHEKTISESKTREEKIKEAMIEAARFSQSSPFMRNKARVKALQESIQYNEKASNAVLSTILSSIVENALLLDTEEYSKLNPNFRKEIKETVSSMLAGGNLNTNISNKQTLTIMEHIARSIPDVKTGVYLTEEEISSIVSKETPERVNMSIDNLTSDVKERVANIVSSENEDIEKIQKDIDEVISISEAAKSKRAASQQMTEQLPPEAYEEEMSPEEMAQIEQQQQQEAQGEEVPEDEYLQYQQDGQSQVVIPQTANKNTAVEVAPDGTVRVNIMREALYREHGKKGMLETLALNEALDMVSQGKPYNGDLAIANALKYLTIIETFKSSNLIKEGLSPAHKKAIKANYTSSGEIIKGVEKDKEESPLLNHKIPKLEKVAAELRKLHDPDGAKKVENRIDSLKQITGIMP
jgi:hypothetical protein